MTSRRQGRGRPRRESDGCPRGAGGFQRYKSNGDNRQPSYRGPCDDQPAEYVTEEKIKAADERLDGLAGQLTESYVSLNDGLCKVQKCMTEGFTKINGQMKEIEKTTDKALQAIDDQIRTAEEELNKNVRLLNNDIAETQEAFCGNLDKARRDMEKMEKHFRREICEILRDMKTDGCS